jgi:hypothetical protein
MTLVGRVGKTGSGHRTRSLVSMVSALLDDEGEMGRSGRARRRQGSPLRSDPARAGQGLDPGCARPRFGRYATPWWALAVQAEGVQLRMAAMRRPDGRPLVSAGGVLIHVLDLLHIVHALRQPAVQGTVQGYRPPVKGIGLRSRASVAGPGHRPLGSRIVSSRVDSRRGLWTSDSAQLSRVEELCAPFMGRLLAFRAAWHDNPAGFGLLAFAFRNGKLA